MRLSPVVLFLSAAACGGPERIDGLLPADDPDVQYIEWVSIPRSEGSSDLVAQVVAASDRPSVVYVGAAWCGSCAAYRSTLESARMLEVHRSVQVIELDLDHHQRLLTELEIRPAGVPHWEAVDGRGHSRGLQLDGRAWAADTLDAMAPPLEAFFAQVRAG